MTGPLTLDFVAGRTVAVLGLGKSGLATARVLAANGAQVWPWDDDEAARDAAADAGFEPVDLATADLSQTAMLVLSPGIPLTHPQPHPVVTAARAVGVEIVGDVELLRRARPQATAVGVTGTNGKSTTTALLGHILHAAGRRCAVGGNLGTPALALDALDADGIYVLELSSYQLDLLSEATFNVAVLLNITPDHLDRHGGMDSYVAAKRRIFRGMGPEATAVVGVDDAPSRELLAGLSGPRAVPISADRPVAGGVYAADGWVVDDMDGGAERIARLADAPALPGVHNAQNAAAATAAARALGLAAPEIAPALASFPGLAHRQERIATLAGVSFVNDSKATNADATARALACYDAVYWIAGGLPKAGGIASLAPLFPRIRHAYLIGKAAEAFAATLDGKVPHTLCGDLKTAVARAASDAEPGTVVLLSPACASWDQFKSFEARGDAFRAHVLGLAVRNAPEARA